MSSYIEEDGAFYVDRMAPDSPEARLLVGIASIDGDIRIAKQCLDALDVLAALPDEPGQKVVQDSLLERVVVALARAFTASNVRPSLRRLVDVPPAMNGDIDDLLLLRNRAVAHSESANTGTATAIVRLVKTDLSQPVSGVFLSAVSVHAGIPTGYIPRVRSLVDWAEGAVTDAQQEAADALFPKIAALDLEAMWAEGHQAIRARADSFDAWRPGARRGAYPPAGQFLMESTLYMDARAASPGDQPD